MLERLKTRLRDLLRDEELEERLALLPATRSEFGVDQFGFDPSYLRYMARPVQWLYDHYFRVQVSGIDNVPDGRCLLIANHSGQLPFDGVMIGTAVFKDRPKPRVVRAMVERFVPSTPFVSYLMPRIGQIVGTPENARLLLRQGEILLAFPEGVRGLNKTWAHRYQLQEFGLGFMRLAIETRSPIVCVAVVGAEEQAPTLYNFKALGKLLGLPAFPVTPTHPLIPGLGLFPLPSRYHITFSPPMSFAGDPNDEDDVIEAKVKTVQNTIQTMIENALAARTSVYL